MHKLVLLRHGESLWNKENRFTGWTDVGLSQNGEEEAVSAAKLLQEENFVFDQAFTSTLQRAIKTLWLALEEMGLMWLPTQISWRLNERHYGMLQGLNKAETAQKYGSEKVQNWRRSFAIPPPPLELTDERHPRNDLRYANINSWNLPGAESLKDTVSRIIPLWEKEILPCLKLGKRLLVVAHGNSLRALIKYLDDVSDQDITQLNIPTGIPLVYELDEECKTGKHYYLGDSEQAKQAADKVAAQTTSKE